MGYAPKNPQPDDDVVVTTRVASARGSISSVWLNYSTQEEHDELIMTPHDSTFTVTIPKQPKGTRVTFAVSATDTDGNTRTLGDFQYTVGFTLEIPDLLFDPMIIGLIVLVFAMLLLFALAHRARG